MHLRQLNLFLLLSLVVAASALGQADPAENSYTTGYLVITPDPGMASPLAIGRFDQPEAKAATEIEATAPNLTDRALVMVSGGDTALAIVNPNSRPVAVTLQLMPNPFIAPAFGPSPKQIEIPAFHQVVKFVREFELGPSATTPILSITSAAPISIAAVKFREGNFSRTPVLKLSTEGFVLPARGKIGGPGAMVFPIFSQGRGLSTLLFLLNPGENTITGRIDLFDAKGDPLPMSLNGLTASTYRYVIWGRYQFTLGPFPKPFKTLEQGDSRYKFSDRRTLLLINTREDWESFYAQHNPDGKPPEVDFSKRSVIVAGVIGQMVCEGVEVVQITRVSDQEFRVRAVEKWTGSGCACILIVAPPHIHIVVTDEKIPAIRDVEWEVDPCVEQSVFSPGRLIR